MAMVSDLAFQHAELVPERQHLGPQFGLALAPDDQEVKGKAEHGVQQRREHGGRSCHNARRDIGVPHPILR